MAKSRVIAQSKKIMFVSKTMETAKAGLKFNFSSTRIHCCLVFKILLKEVQF